MRRFWKKRDGAVRDLQYGVVRNIQYGLQGNGQR